jgi:sensor c-di-GMP phosphodiesterase-like protein
MPLLGRRTFTFLAFALVGTTIGCVLGLALGRLLLLRSAGGVLSDYALDLSRHGDAIYGDLRQVFVVSNSSAGSFCSDQDLIGLRSQTFRSHDFKDMGRTRGGILYCSAFLGKIAQPYLEGEPTLKLRDGTRVYTDVAVMLDGTGGHRATILENGGTNVVLSPDAFGDSQQGKLRYRITIRNPDSRLAVAIAGASAPAELSTGNRHRLAVWGIGSGLLSRSSCSQHSPFCATTYETTEEVWVGSRAMQWAYSGSGGLAGLGLGIAIALLYLRIGTLRHQLRSALHGNSNSLRVVYQPIVRINSGECVGVEALIRWSDQTGTPVPPDVFIPIAEEGGFIDEVTAWMIQRAVSELCELLRERPEFTLAINVAASDVNGEKLACLLDEAVDLTGIQPRQIILELTERSTADLGEVCRSIQRLAARGYQVHIDDFGTGFSNLSYLDQLAVGAIKVDRAFTRTIGTDAVTASILPQILTMAEALHLDVIVEGVETEAQERYLESTGKALHAQGWRFSKPMSAADLLVHLEQPQESEAALAGLGARDAWTVPSCSSAALES